MPQSFRTTGNVPLMEKVCVGVVFPRTVLFLNVELEIIPGQVICVGEAETYPYGALQSVDMYPAFIELQGHGPLYILGKFVAEDSPQCRLERIRVG